MIPIRDTLSSRTVPVVTYGIIGINALVFMLQSSLGQGLEPFVMGHGLVPAKFTYTVFGHTSYSPVALAFSLISYMFLHGGLWHFVGNMWFLYIFGDNVEDHLGSLRYCCFYLLAGIASGLFHIFLNPYSRAPTIGASGAIAGVMGAYFILYPRAKILTLIPIIIIPWFVEIPAFLFLGFWFVIQFFNATGSASGSGIAWWAHVGGFLAGMFMVRLSRKIPGTGTNDMLRKVTVKKTTPRLQVIQTQALEDPSHDLAGSIEISTLESLVGTQKLVNIPWGFYKRLYRVKVPPGVKQGTRLRLAGLGRLRPDSSRGDLYLQVDIKNAG
ncbi:MAG: rhomboid family intramembrane serine protease [Pseudomonadota bacterium]